MAILGGKRFFMSEDGWHELFFEPEWREVLPTIINQNIKATLFQVALPFLCSFTSTFLTPMDSFCLYRMIGMEIMPR
jgi:hypothetical protein